jgi:hypothetical protein
MYEIVGRYGASPVSEVVDEAPTKDEALYLLGEYGLAFGSPWSFWLETTSEWTCAAGCGTSVSYEGATCWDCETEE